MNAAAPPFQPRPLTYGIQFAVYTLRTSIFSVASTLIAPLLLTQLAQGQELLNTITDRQILGIFQDPVGFLHYVLFLLALLAWAFASWYGSRVLLQRDLAAWKQDAGSALRFVEEWNRWFPRALGLIGMSVIAIYVLKRQMIAGLFAVLFVVLFGVLVSWRRWFFSLQDVNADSRPVLLKGDRIGIWLTLAFSLVLLLGLAYANFWLARLLGAPVVLFLGLACLVIFGSIVLTYLPLSYGWPSLALLPILAAFGIAAATLNRNHGLTSRLVPGSDRGCAARPDAAEHLAKWAATHPGKIVLVAAEGGASRSAWWTSHVLTALDYASAGTFSRQVYAVSGVSGGSLGATTYVGLLEQRGAPAAQMQALGFPTQQQCWDMRAHLDKYPLPMQSECFLGRDFLSTTLGYLLFPDLMQRFIPVSIDSWDRSLGLERTWSTDWRHLFGKDVFREPMDSLYRDTNGAVRNDIPLLFLNTTRVQAGRSAIQAPVGIRSTELDDVFDGRLRTRGLPLSAVVHNSARFPVISPGGDVETWDGVHWDTVVDGGYFENSGAATLTELIRSFNRRNTANTKPAPTSCSKEPAVEGAAQTATEPTESVEKILERILVVFIMNDPVSHLSVLPNGSAQDDPQYGRKPVVAQEELLTPVVGLFNTRSARADSSKRALIDLLPGAATEKVTEIFLSRGGLADYMRPAMSWFMGPESRQAMWQAVASPYNAQELCKLLRRAEVSAEQCLDRLAAFQSGRQQP